VISLKGGAGKKIPVRFLSGGGNEGNLFGEEGKSGATSEDFIENGRKKRTKSEEHPCGGCIGTRPWERNRMLGEKTTGGLTDAYDESLHWPQEEKKMPPIERWINQRGQVTSDSSVRPVDRWVRGDSTASIGRQRAEGEEAQKWK